MWTTDLRTCPAQSTSWCSRISNCSISAGPLAAFEVAARHVAPSAYRLQVLARSAGPVSSSSGAAMVVGEASRTLAVLDKLVVSGGIGTRNVAACETTLDFIREASIVARRVASVCSGAFVLAAAGLLDGCRRHDALAACRGVCTHVSAGAGRARSHLRARW